MRGGSPPAVPDLTRLLWVAARGSGCGGGEPAVRPSPRSGRATDPIPIN